MNQIVLLAFATVFGALGLQPSQPLDPLPEVTIAATVDTSSVQVLGEDVLLTQPSGATTLVAASRCSVSNPVPAPETGAVTVAIAGGDEMVTTYKDASGVTHTIRTEYRSGESEERNIDRHTKRVLVFQRVFQPAPTPPPSR